MYMYKDSSNLFVRNLFRFSNSEVFSIIKALDIGALRKPKIIINTGTVYRFGKSICTQFILMQQIWSTCISKKYNQQTWEWINCAAPLQQTRQQIHKTSLELVYLQLAYSWTQLGVSWLFHSNSSGSGHNLAQVYVPDISK